MHQQRADRPGVAARRLEPEVAHHEPQRAPGGSRAALAQQATRAGARPDEQADQRVQQNRPGRPGERARHRHEHHPERLAEPPHGERPGAGDGDRKLDGGPVEQADADRHLDQRERRVHGGLVVLERLCPPGDAVRDPRRLAGGIAGEHGDEAVRVHERLELQAAVEQPDQPEHRLGGARRVGSEVVARGGERPTELGCGGTRELRRAGAQPSASRALADRSSPLSACVSSVGAPATRKSADQPSRPAR